MFLFIFPFFFRLAETTCERVADGQEGGREGGRERERERERKREREREREKQSLSARDGQRRERKTEREREREREKEMRSARDACFKGMENSPTERVQWLSRILLHRVILDKMRDERRQRSMLRFQRDGGHSCTACSIYPPTVRRVRIVHV